MGSKLHLIKFDNSIKKNPKKTNKKKKKKKKKKQQQKNEIHTYIKQGLNSDMVH